MGESKHFSAFYQDNKTLVKEYLENRINLLKLQGVKSISRLMSLLVVVFITTSLALFVLLFMGMSFSWWMAGITQSNAIGFLCGAGFFALILGLAFWLRKPIFQNPLIRMFISVAAPEADDENGVD